MNEGGFLSNATSMLDQGGPVMYVILVMSILALAIIIAKVVQFYQLKLGSTDFIQDALNALRKGDDSQAESVLKGSPNPIARVMETAKTTAENERLTQDDRDAQVSAAGSEYVSKMTTFLRSLELLANLSPLVGLFGTVTGMIAAFGQLELAGSQVDPSLLAGGIWQALLTTAFGLMVAIPTVACFSLLDARVERTRREMNNAAVRTLEIFRERQLNQSAQPAAAAGD